MLNPKQLLVFIEVAESKSFSKAAEKLCISQSAVSQNIKLLEDAIGKILIGRSKDLPLTTDGIKLFEHAKKIQLLEYDLLVRLESVKKNNFNL